jgi:multidrug efflux pump subunit AcrB
VSEALQTALATLRKRLPEGVAIDLSFDFAPNIEAAQGTTAPGYLLVDVHTPDNSSMARNQEVLRRAEKILGQTPGVKNVLGLSEQPFDLFGDHPCLLVRLGPGGEGPAEPGKLMGRLRDRLRQELQEAACRLRDLSGPGRLPRGACPLDLAVYDTGDRGSDALQAAAGDLARRLGQARELTDVLASRAAVAVPWLELEIDRGKAKTLGVSMDEVLNVLRAKVGPAHAGDFGPTGRGRLVIGPGAVRLRGEEVTRLQVRNSRGEQVPLGAVVAVRDTTGPRAVGRYNMYPMVEVTANPAPGVSLAEARERCEAIAREVLPVGYGVGWLSDPPPSR